MKSLNPVPVRIVQNFTRAAADLRAVFDAKFADPRDTRSDRFVWDYWHIENQYSVLRTPARYYFPKPLFDRLEGDLQAYGQRVLGCNGISDPWISLYTDGAFQNFHSDAPHGPWAYVFSLTKWKSRTFRGGETLIARDRMLDYWPSYASEDRNSRGLEFDDLFRAVPAEWNQLVVFDPRLPHGVREVRGPREPLEGRLVVHGWFVEPRPFVEGPLGVGAKSKATARALSEGLEPISRALAVLTSLQGTVSIRVAVSPEGKTGRQELLTHTLVDCSAPGSREASTEALREIAAGLAGIRLPKSSGRSQVTIPFLFR